MLVFRHAKLNDELHVQFSERLGELDDVTPHIQAGRPFRFKYKELFDVGNIEEDGSLVKPGSHRWYYGKVKQYHPKLNHLNMFLILIFFLS